MATLNQTDPLGQIDIESIVRQVIARLQIVKPSVEQPDTSGAVKIRDRVVTLASIQQVEPKQKIRVRSDAILTPAVADELKQRESQSSVMIDQGAQAKSKNKFVRLVADEASQSSLVEAIKRQLEGRGISHCDRAAKTVVFSDSPARTVMQSIRDGKRAAAVSRHDEVARFAKQIDADLLVFDTTHFNLSACVNGVVRFMEVTS